MTSRAEDVRLAPFMVLPPRRQGLAALRARAAAALKVVGPALGNVFLIPHPFIGLILWAALASTPRHAVFGLLGLGVAVLGSILLGIKEEVRVGGALKANTLLAAIAVGWMTSQTLYPVHIQVGIAIAAAGAAFVTTAAIIRALEKTEFPALLWGYCIVASAIFAVFPIGTRLATEIDPWWLAPLHTPADWSAAFLRSLGSLLFSPTVAAGGLVALAILLWSRLAFACGMIGWAAGIGVSIALQELGIAFHWLPLSYNFFVAGMALGSAYFLPGLSTAAVAAVAGGTAALIAVGLQSTFPAFASLPICSAVTIWLGLGTIALAGERSGIAGSTVSGATPEEARWRSQLWSRRIGDREPLLVVPVAGVVEATQSFDGPFSHVGPFRHALDFQRPVAADPESFGTIWRAPVYAPAGGVVERVRDSVADNPVGVSNYAESWGNYVCIRLDQGGWAMLAHLRHGSIAVAPGNRVEIGTYLGEVGNSGRSPVSHLHMHVQSTPQAGSPTVPFRLANFRSGLSPSEPLLEWHAAAVPARGTLVAASSADPSSHAALASLCPGTSIWSIERSGEVPRLFTEPHGRSSVRIARHLDEFGRMMFSSPDGSRLMLVFAPDAWRITEQRGGSALLRLLALSVPSIPYAAQPGIAWSDFVPATLAATERWLSFPLAPYNASPFIRSRSVCTAAPSAESSSLVVETVVRSRYRRLPTKLACTLEAIKGPTRIEATFERGSLVYSLVSLRPGQPIDVDTSPIAS